MDSKQEFERADGERVSFSTISVPDVGASTVAFDFPGFADFDSFNDATQPFSSEESFAETAGESKNSAVVFEANFENFEDTTDSGSVQA